MIYEYEVQTEGGSSFDNLERLGDRLQEVLNGEDAASRMAAGWEIWQVNTLNDHQGVNGLVIVYRRAETVSALSSQQVLHAHAASSAH